MSNPILEALATAERSALHLEMRDNYTLNDPEFVRWKEGHRLDPEDRQSWWGPFFDTVADTVARGVEMKRARIVSEPVTDYIRYEYDVTFPNIAAGELIRWLPRQQAQGLALPHTDFWLFDETRLLFTYFSGDGDVVDRQWCDDPGAVEFVRSSFDEVWKRAVPHEEYRPR
ncbi:DUF6879 family protein [Streptomyces virginiae]|uniref:DUF6879 family protein n=1 Tax=Streptomyces virginiae TaxID=1961 RepID=UPI003797D1D1